MTKFDNDPEYRLRWPPDIFVEELERLVQRGAAQGRDDDWAEEVEELLRQAFSSPVPAEDFRKTFSPPPSRYDPLEEPF